jgi:Mg2+-importing ATPase
MAVGLPYTPFAAEIGLYPLPMSILGVMLLIVAAYIITADVLKVWFFKKYQKA